MWFRRPELIDFSTHQEVPAPKADCFLHHCCLANQRSLQVRQVGRQSLWCADWFGPESRCAASRTLVRLFPVTITFVCLGRIATSSEEAELGDDSRHRGAFTSGTPTFSADLSLNTKLVI
jgi:hypothetical protein